MIKRAASVFAIFASSLIILAAAGPVQAASGTWGAAPTDALWATAANWTASVVPGAINLTGNNTNNDVTTFNTAIFNNGSVNIGDASNPIVITAGTGGTPRNLQIGGIVFDTNAGAYQIGTNGGTTLFLSSRTTTDTSLTNSVRILSTFAGTTAETIAAPISIRGPSSQDVRYTFSNDAPSASATLNFTGTVTSSGSGTTRPLTIILDGSNTGANSINSIVQENNGTANGGNRPSLTKQGTGTWKITGSSYMPQTNAGQQVNVDNGILALGAIDSLGATGGPTGTALAAANVRVNATGTMRFDFTGTLVNAGVTLNGTGRLLANGSPLVNTVPVNAAATSPTLATTSSTDVFGVGTISGGAAATVMNVSGPGTINLFSDNSGYLGTWLFNGGTTIVNASGGLGTNSSKIAFGASSTAKIQLNSNSITVAGLNTNATPGTTILENGAASDSTLNLNIALASPSTYAGVLRDNDGSNTGKLHLNKNGLGKLTLGGNNTYTGVTNINQGTVLVNGNHSGTGDWNVNSGGTLGGNGTIAGNVIINSGATLAPGASVHNFTVGGLTIGGGSILDYEFNSTANDKTIVTTNNALNFDGTSNAAFHFYTEGGTTTWTSTGTYDLITFVGANQGNALDSTWFTASGNNPHVLNRVAGLTYQFQIASNKLQVLIGGTPPATWSFNGDGNWGLGTNWSSGTAPNAVNAAATFGSATAGTVAVTLEGAKTVGAITLSSTTTVYTIGNSANTLTLDNTGSGNSSIQDSLGSHTINAPINLVTSTDVAVASAPLTLTLSGAISGTSTGINKFGPGTLAITNASNTYTGDTRIDDGTVTISGSNSLGTSAGTIHFTGGAVTNPTLKPSASGLTVGNHVSIDSDTTATMDTNGNDLTLSGTIDGGGNLQKNSAGKLILTSNNSYSGTTTINGGTLQLGNSTATGTLGFGDTTIGGGATLDVNHSADFTISSNIGGTTGTLNKNGNTILTLSGSNTFGTATGGGINVNGGTLQVGSGTGFPTGAILTMAASTILDLNGNPASTGATGSAGSFNPADDTVIVTNNSNGSTGTFTWNLPADKTYGGLFKNGGDGTGAVSLTKNGAGNLTLTADNNMSGNLTVSGGTVTLPTGGKLDHLSTLTVVNPGTLTVSGGSLTVSGATTFNHTNGAIFFNLQSGTATFNTVNTATNPSQNYFINATGGTFTANAVTLTRTAVTGFTVSFADAPGTTVPNTMLASNANAQTTGFYVNGSTVNISGNLTVGTAGTNSSAYMRIDSGNVTAGGTTVIGVNNTGRWSFIEVAGGSFTSTNGSNTAVVQLGQTAAGAEALIVRGAGVATVDRVQFGPTIVAPAADVGGLAALVVNTGGTMYLGAGGISRGYSYVPNVDPAPSLTARVELATGILGAKADWSSAADIPFRLGDIATGFTFKAADASDVAHNITINGVVSDSISTTNTALPGKLVKTGGGTLTLNGNNTYTGGTQIDAGTLAVGANSNLGDPAGAVTIGAGTLRATAGFSSARNIAANDTASRIDLVTGLLNSTGTISVNSKLSRTGAGTLKASNLAIAGSTDAWTGTLNVTNGKVILANADAPSAATMLSQTTNQLKTGITVNLDWSGTGITSSTVPTDPDGNKSVGVILNDGGLYGDGTSAPLWRGQSVTSTDVLVAYTYAGDADLNGLIDGIDYALTDNGFNSNLSGWFNGDFDYNGVVDGIDYALLDNAFNTQGAPLTGGGSSPAAVTPVPEPATWLLAITGFAGMVALRRLKRFEYLP